MEVYNQRLKNFISKALDIEITRIGKVRLIKNMYRLFIQCPDLHASVNNLAGIGIFDMVTCEKFKYWGNSDKKAANNHDFEDFKTFLSFPDAMLLSFCLYEQWIGLTLCLEDDDSVEEYDEDEVISIRSSDNVVFEMDKNCATTQSLVLKDLIDSTGGHGEIPLPGVSSLILPKIGDFCKERHKFDTIMESLVEILKSIVNPYKASITRFLNTNKPILSYLQQAANYLHIPSLLELTSQAVGSIMEEKTVEDIAEWYVRTSISPFLSVFGIEEVLAL